MPKIQSLIAVEQAMGHAVIGLWDQAGSALVADLLGRLQDRDMVGAYALADSITTDHTAKTAQARVEELSVSAFLLGTSRITPLHLSAYVTGEQPLPDRVQHAASLCGSMLGVAAERIRQAVRAVLATFEEGQRPVFKDGAVNKAEFDLADALNAAVLGTGRQLFDLAANQTTSRLVSYGFLSEAVEQQITEYQLNAVLDHRTSAICRRLHGKTFRVDPAYSTIEAALNVADPNELASVHPWLRGTKPVLADLEQLSDEDLTAKYGVLVPPFHPRCRTTLSKTTEILEAVHYVPVSVPPSAPVPAAPLPIEPPAPPSAPASAFDLLPPKLAEDLRRVIDENLIDHRSPAMRQLVDKVVPPVLRDPENIARLVHAWQRGLAGADDELRVVMDVTDQFLDIRLRSAEGAVERRLYYQGQRPTHVMHDLFLMPVRQQGLGNGRALFQEALDLYLQLGFTEIRTHANIDVGGYAWARFGFTVNEADAQGLLLALLAQNKIILQLYERARARGTKALWEVADSLEGKRALLDTSWVGKMDLTDPEVLARVRSYVNR